MYSLSPTPRRLLSLRVSSRFLRMFWRALATSASVTGWAFTPSRVFRKMPLASSRSTSLGIWAPKRATPGSRVAPTKGKTKPAFLVSTRAL